MNCKCWYAIAAAHRFSTNEQYAMGLRGFTTFRRVAEDSGRVEGCTRSYTSREPQFQALVVAWRRRSRHLYPDTEVINPVAEQISEPGMTSMSFISLSRLLFNISIQFASICRAPSSTSSRGDACKRRVVVLYEM